MTGSTGYVALVASKPLHNAGIRDRLGRFTEDVGIHQVFHSVSGDWDSTGTKKPFLGTGQEPIDDALVRMGGSPDQVILARVEARNLERLARRNPILLPQLGR